MKIKNLTEKQQPLDVRELTGERNIYTIYVAPKGETEVDKVAIPHIEKYAGIFSFDGKCEEAPVVETPASDEKPEENHQQDPDKDEIPEEKSEEKKSDLHICDVCGQEFASARALSMHKNKAHAE